MKKYQFFKHTADSKFRAYGKNLQEQFSNAALAMTSIMTDPKKIQPKKKQIIKAKASDEKALLYDFLENLLILLDSEAFILNKIQSLKIKKSNNKLTLTATALGDTIDDKYQVQSDVKAVTYHEMEITPSYVQVVVDI